jgi:hypothetical protein
MMIQTRWSRLCRLLLIASLAFTVTVAVREAAWGQTGDRLFTARRDSNLWNFMYTPPALADMNEDGVLDVIANSVGASNHAIGIYIGNGEGAFEKWTETITGILPFAITTGDFNEDGHRDVAALSCSKDHPLWMRA